jgi:hypothetical protein
MPRAIVIVPVMWTVVIAFARTVAGDDYAACENSEQADQAAAAGDESDD